MPAIFAMIPHVVEGDAPTALVAAQQGVERAARHMDPVQGPLDARPGLVEVHRRRIAEQVGDHPRRTARGPPPASATMELIAPTETGMPNTSAKISARRS